MTRSYLDNLALELRLLDVPGDRIGDALAQVESHLGESSADPVAEFGEPRAYAQELAPQLPSSDDRPATRLDGPFWALIIGTLLVGFSGMTLTTAGVGGLLVGEAAIVSWVAALTLGLTLATVAMLATWTNFFLRRPWLLAIPLLATLGGSIALIAFLPEAVLALPATAALVTGLVLLAGTVVLGYRQARWGDDPIIRPLPEMTNMPAVDAGAPAPRRRGRQSLLPWLWIIFTGVVVTIQVIAHVTG